jgi:hypothetical protein
MLVDPLTPVVETIGLALVGDLLEGSRPHAIVERD